MSDPIQTAVILLRAGELVAFPTETVYGLGADALNPVAVARIFAAKGRPSDHPLIVHLPAGAHLDDWARDIPEAARRLAQAFWPGPLTLILQRHPKVPDAVTGGQDTVGLRVPKHPLALQLLAAFGSGIAAPSANRYGRISPTTAQHVREELGGRVPLILDGGPCQVGIESTILDLSRGRPVLLRPGGIDPEALAGVLGERPEIAHQHKPEDEAAPRVSGSHAAHYAPRTPLELVPGECLAAAVAARAAQGARPAVLARRGPIEIAGEFVWLEAPADPAGYAHDLYANLRSLDYAECDVILVEAPPAADAWLAVSDRLLRAAAGSGEDDEP
jgi:L-threonylcarbamoyladenylate synthase